MRTTTLVMAAVVAIGATPLIVAAPASAYVSCPQGGGAANLEICAQLCQLTGQCAGGGPQGPAPQGAPQPAALPPPAAPPLPPGGAAPAALPPPAAPPLPPPVPAAQPAALPPPAAPPLPPPVPAAGPPAINCADPAVFHTYQMTCATMPQFNCTVSGCVPAAPPPQQAAAPAPAAAPPGGVAPWCGNGWGTGDPAQCGLQNLMQNGIPNIVAGDNPDQAPFPSFGAPTPAAPTPPPSASPTPAPSASPSPSPSPSEPCFTGYGLPDLSPACQGAP
jgi:hypothetical protein